LINFRVFFCSLLMWVIVWHVLGKFMNWYVIFMLFKQTIHSDHWQAHW
jgi:hypothetical protein